jgi:hypothetical protein
MQKFESLTDATEARAALKKDLREISNKIRLWKREEAGDYSLAERAQRTDDRQKLFDAGAALEDQIAVVDAWIEEHRAQGEAERAAASLGAQQGSEAHQLELALIAQRRERIRAESLRYEAQRQEVARATKDAGREHDGQELRRQLKRLDGALEIAVAALGGGMSPDDATRIILKAFPDILLRIARDGVPVDLDDEPEREPLRIDDRIAALFTPIPGELAAAGAVPCPVDGSAGP